LQFSVDPPRLWPTEQSLVDFNPYGFVVGKYIDFFYQARAITQDLEIAVLTSLVRCFTTSPSITWL
jgi:hypothetical protein